MRVILLRATVICLFGAFAVGCASHDEVARSPSPDHALDAVVVEGNGGATTSFWYGIYVTEPGAAYGSGTFVASLYGAIRSETAWGVNLKWKSPTSLDVEYLSAKKASLDRPHPTVNGRRVDVVLRSGVRDPEAKPGGMLFNR